MRDITSELLSGVKIIELPENSLFTFSFFNHESVGNTSSCKISGNSVELVEKIIKYEYPDCEIPGGDEAEAEYKCRCIRKGSSKITIKILFRGDLENKYKIKIKVT